MADQHPASPEALEALLDRANQFRRMRLPGQPMGMHMGTLYLVNDLSAAVATLRTQLAVAEAERDALRAALTPSGETKADYMGEVLDPDTRRRVSWTAIKMIMAMISARATTPPEPPEGERG
jgi:hypothetical protein